MLRIGLDVGSTTIKLVALNEQNAVVFTKYTRHNAQARSALVRLLEELATAVEPELGDPQACLCLTGSVGLGIAEQCTLNFIQEVTAAARVVKERYPHIGSLVDIGGEDAKVILFKNSQAEDLRMNGNCAGGTGAFIDQMAVLLGVETETLGDLASRSTQLYPIASRCGVFCKTDIQNLIAKNVEMEDIAASIFRAVAVQTMTTLAKGSELQLPVLFCGGPLTFIPALCEAFRQYMQAPKQSIILPELGTLFSAWGASFYAHSAYLANGEDAGSTPASLSQLRAELKVRLAQHLVPSGRLAPIFKNNQDLAAFRQRMDCYRLKTAMLPAGRCPVFIGVDSGSTTTKIAVIDRSANLLFSYYRANGGQPIAAVAQGLGLLRQECLKHETELEIIGSCSTGYGEDLIKAAFQFNHGIVETIAHYLAAHYLNEDVSFILDIGGQDMKAIFVNKQIIDRIDINEACSSGCGSFLETFARSLGQTLQDFCGAACLAQAPCDLGTRCTVFMNSKVKQVLREGASIGDISAGLAYSVVKNCLYKVLKLRDLSILGKKIVVQGGTMRNDAIVHALELLTKNEVVRCDQPELMGAFGCALYAREQSASQAAALDRLIAQARFTSRSHHCHGCENQCPVVAYSFENGGQFFSGNRCEKIFHNAGAARTLGTNVHEQKYHLLFDRLLDKPAEAKPEKPPLVLGIPRCLNMYEEYPFWHRLFTGCGIEVRLSAPSSFTAYENNAALVMSDNICFPAKLVHSHITNLIEQGVSRIFMPFVVYEQSENERNSFNCPIVTAYSEVIKGMDLRGIALDAPTISFKDEDLLWQQCLRLLQSYGIGQQAAGRAFHQALEAQGEFLDRLQKLNLDALKKARDKKSLVLLLAGRPYHTDPLIQHQVARMIGEMGITVLTEDIARHETTERARVLAQWAFPNRILKSASWCVAQGNDVHYLQMTSFGCGPDSFLIDAVRDLLLNHQKPFTQLKLDDINNVGSMKLRVRSLVESLRLAYEQQAVDSIAASSANSSSTEIKSVHQVPGFSKGDSRRKLLIPFFTPFISPLLPAMLRAEGYQSDSLPISDSDSCELGLKFANNEVCYPATLIIGDVIRAFQRGDYDPNHSSVILPQTGGQCRASNYVALLQRALLDAGFTNTPVVGLSYGEELNPNQESFRVNWLRFLPGALRAVLFSDCIAKFYYAAVVREKNPGMAEALKQKYLKLAAELVSTRKSARLYDYLEQAAREFTAICQHKELPKVGVVGEIYLKYHPFAHKGILDRLIERGIEVVPPIMLEFFTQFFVNQRVNVQNHLQNRLAPDFVLKLVYRLVQGHIAKTNRLAASFPYFTPFEDVFAKADLAGRVINLNAQFGEGWLLPAEVLAYYSHGIKNVISLQPFGCIANHIISKGLERRVKKLCPELNFLSLDFDSGVSEVNVLNRMLLFIENLR